MLKDYKDQIQDADLGLVGIGRELRADRLIDFKKAITNEHYQNLIGKDDEDSKWMRTVYEREYLLSMKETDLFKELEEVLEGKEYFGLFNRWYQMEVNIYSRPILEGIMEGANTEYPF